MFLKQPLRACLQGDSVPLASELTLAGGQGIARVYMFCLEAKFDR